MKQRMRSITTQTAAILLAALLIADAMFGYVMLRHSRNSMTAMVHERMLDVSNTAAALIDGDALRALRAEDVGSDAYRRIYDTLAVFEANITLNYIYAVRDDGDGTFTFIVDPAEDATGFGTPVVATDALRSAAGGVSAVDDKPYTDIWGSFYSAYSPVFDSAGRVAGIVAVDFNAEWFDAQLADSTRTVLITTVISLVVGVGIALLATRRLRRRIRELNGELANLAADMEGLTREIDPGERAPEAGTQPAAAKKLPRDGDDLSPLLDRIRSVHEELRGYIAYAKEQAYIDAMTGLGNKTAYLEMLKASAPHFADGTAAFTLTILDINDLKGVNDSLGHEVGDGVIADCAELIRRSFGPDHAYRIGGDEFIIVRAHATELDLAKWHAMLESELVRFNAARDPERPPVSVSWGSAVYDPATDADYRAVFRRADDAMYRMKNEFYSSRGERCHAPAAEES